MLEKDFLKHCEEALIELSDHIEKLDKNTNLDVDYSDGILKIIVSKTNQTYVINRNSGNQKIWYSSPLTGADYFSFDEQNNAWISDKKIELKEKLLAEIKNFL